MYSVVKYQKLNICWWVSQDIFIGITIMDKYLVCWWVGGGIGSFVREVDLLIAQDFAAP